MNYDQENAVRRRAYELWAEAGRPYGSRLRFWFAAEKDVTSANPKQISAIVAIPVRNERERIVACLDALAAQTGLGSLGLGVLLFLNNCTDDTAAVVQSIDFPLPIKVIEREDPQASAGWARRIAMESASGWLAEASSGTNGVLLTTDADSRVPPDWVSRNLSSLAAGADLVAGRIKLDPDEAAMLPASLHARGRLEAEYETLLTEIEARLDPQKGDPWPCHWSNSGATLAVRHAVYEAVGGMPDMATGEDRAFVETVRANGFVVRHDCAIEVVTSGRLDGRAAGGVADTIKLRCDLPDSHCDDRLEPLFRLIMRVLWRRWLRELHGKNQLQSTWKWAPALAIAPSTAKRIALFSPFGVAHAAIETASPRLLYQPVRPKDLATQIKRAYRFVCLLRAFHRRKPSRRRLPVPSPSVLGLLKRS